jgi:hypothetical protein
MSCHCDFSLHPSLYVCPNARDFEIQTPPPPLGPITVGFFQRFYGETYIRQNERVFLGRPCFAPSGYLCEYPSARLKQ